MKSPSPLFGGDSPLVAVSTPEGRKRVRRQLVWFAGASLLRPAFSNDVPDSPADLLSDRLMDLLFKRAGAGPEKFLNVA
jgi:hypothetical protein